MCHVAWTLFFCSLAGVQAKSGLRIEDNDCSNKTSRRFWNDTLEVDFHKGAALIGGWTKDFPPGFDRYCITETGGSCKYWGCDASRGPTDCRNNVCYCKKGYCAIRGQCVDHCYTDGCQTGECRDRGWNCGKECESDTGGTCQYFGCNSVRDSVCVEGKCLCRENYCSETGKCIGKVLPARPLDFDICVKDTGGTCKHMGCDSKRGATECVDGKCMCAFGYCAVGGTCVSHCKSNTVGTCSHLGCDASRGPTSCQSGTCMCQEGTCADLHHTTCAHQCEKDTLGTCKWLACSSSHGPTNCVDGKCLCMDNQCSQAGICVPLPGAPPLPATPPGFEDACVKDTTGTCKLLGCDTSRGMTDCISGKCVCQFGYCAVNGECVNTCETETFGTCEVMGCKSSRGPTDCVDGKCVCQAGTCADHSKYGCAHPCEPDTQGTCAWLACSASRGPTYCHEGKCLCQEEYCSEAGKCVKAESMKKPTDPAPPNIPEIFKDVCQKDTGGTCSTLSCDSSRGPVDCINGHCVCQYGYCAVSGTCVNTCETETTGTCEHLDCNTDRGPVDCVDGKCVCQEGTCADANQYSCSHPCEEDSGGTCSWLACKSSRGPTMCIDGKCLCQHGYCSQGGTCLQRISMVNYTKPDPPDIPEIFTDVCQKDTGGTCTTFACAERRGPTACIDGKCVCQYGYCAVNGECVNTCETETTGTCDVLDCNTDRGPVDCVDGKCICQEGTCADNSKYGCAHPCESDSGGTCAFLACKSSRGPTNCVDGKCVCQDDYCAQAGKCIKKVSGVEPTDPAPPNIPDIFKDTCQKDTGGTCSTLSCDSSRGPVDCIDGKCVCRFGYCAVSGTCINSCESFTTGTCAELDCNTDRGPVDCIDGKCVCQAGTCADANQYSCSHPCEEDSGGTCAFLACKSSRGPTTCIDGKCICEAGYCSQTGTCMQRLSGLEHTEPDPPIIPEIFKDVCQKDTGGTCKTLSCRSSRGQTACIDGKCICEYGYCAVNGECVNTCETKTTGTCEALDCNTDRGPVDCVDGQCICQEGTCADHSKYACAHPCESDSGGTCAFLACKSSRGPTNCVDGKCICKDDYCAQAGLCIKKVSGVEPTDPDPPDIPEVFGEACMKDTGGTCAELACSAHRGPTECINGKCLCKFGYCSVNGECVNTCGKETTGTCANLPCNSDRGSVDCVDSKCVCQDDACADNSKYACSPPCASKTGGTCKWVGCGTWRGATDCVDGECLCQEEYCAVGAFGKRTCFWKWSGMREPTKSAVQQEMNRLSTDFRLAANRGFRALRKSPPMVAAVLAGLAAALLTVGIAVSAQVSYRRISLAAREPLLGTEGAAAC